MLRGSHEAPRKPRMEPQRRQVGRKRSPGAAKLRPRDVKIGSYAAKMVPKKGSQWEVGILRKHRKNNGFALIFNGLDSAVGRVWAEKMLVERHVGV